MLLCRPAGEPTTGEDQLDWSLPQTTATSLSDEEAGEPINLTKAAPASSPKCPLSFGMDRILAQGVQRNVTSPPQPQPQPHNSTAAAVLAPFPAAFQPPSSFLPYQNPFLSQQAAMAAYMYGSYPHMPCLAPLPGLTPPSPHPPVRPFGTGDSGPANFVESPALPAMPPSFSDFVTGGATSTPQPPVDTPPPRCEAASRANPLAAKRALNQMCLEVEFAAKRSVSPMSIATDRGDLVARSHVSGVSSRTSVLAAKVSSFCRNFLENTGGGYGF